MTKRPWTDDEMLTVLHALDAGYTRRQAGELVGRTKCAVIGMTDRVRRDLEESENFSDSD